MNEQATHGLSYEAIPVDKNFYEYARNFYHYRYEFYFRSENPGNLDGVSPADRKLKIFDLLAHGNILADQWHNVKRPLQLEVFPFHIDHSLPRNQIKDQLDSFQKIVLDSHKLKNIDPSGYMYVLHDFIRDGKGNIDYFKAKGGQPFSLWKRYLKAYDLHKTIGANKWQNISMDLGYYDPAKSNEKAASVQANRDVEQAMLLIEKSSSTTFPY